MGIGVRAVAVSGNSLMNRPRGPSGECRMEVGLGTMQFRQGTLNSREAPRAWVDGIRRIGSNERLTYFSFAG